MIVNAIKIQRFRANDLVDDGGKQFELGRSWCDDFWKSHTNLTHAGKYFRPSKVKITSPTLPK